MSVRLYSLSRMINRELATREGCGVAAVGSTLKALRLEAGVTQAVLAPGSALPVGCSSDGGRRKAHNAGVGGAGGSGSGLRDRQLVSTESSGLMAGAAGRYAAVSLFSGCGGMDLGAEQIGPGAGRLGDRQRALGGGDLPAQPGPAHRRGRHHPGSRCPTCRATSCWPGRPARTTPRCGTTTASRRPAATCSAQVARYLDELRPAGVRAGERARAAVGQQGHSVDAGAPRAALAQQLRLSRGGRAGVRYDLSAQVVDMADLGVPQHRERLIVIGSAPRPRGPAAGHPDAVRRHPDHGRRRARPQPAAGQTRRTTRRAGQRRRRRAAEADPAGQNYEVIPEGHPLAVRRA